MPKQNQDPQYLDEHHQRISEFAADYFDDDERDEFIGALMERRGYKRVQHTSWEAPAPDPKDGQGGQGGGGRQRPAYFKR